jgi:hypothetical protein
MFQYAMGLAQAKRLRTSLALDITSLRRDPMRQYNLGLFPNINEPVVSGYAGTIHEAGMPYDQRLVDLIKDGDILNGYWQTENYFSWDTAHGVNNIYDELEHKFEVKEDCLSDWHKLCLRAIQEAGNTSTFLTIRRTDYLQKQDYHGVLSRGYYLAAIDAMRQMGVEPRIFVFSDDPGWCRAALHDGSFPLNIDHSTLMVCGSFYQTTPQHLGSEHIDLFLMSKCHHGILANSTFSWWGAWLSESANRFKKQIHIAPEQWFTTQQVDSRDIVPARWVRL